MMKHRNLLEVNGLTKHFYRTRGVVARRVIGTVRAVSDVNFFIRRGETLALVGESGCGKTTTGRCIMRAIEPTSGEILLRMNGSEGHVNIVALNRKELIETRNHMSMICQDPYSSLNPRMSVLDIVGEAFLINKIITKRRELQERVAGLLRMVGLDPDYGNRYPHAFSGGQRQRIAIARSLALQPEFIVADEPVSALDVSVQAQILNLLGDLQEKFGLTYLFIAHNLAVVEYISNRIAVMYVGKIVELADTEELLSNPKHPYTEALFSAIPKPDPKYEMARIILRGDVADPADPPSGCYFHPRCRYATDICKQEEPSLMNTTGNIDHPHFAACHRAEELKLLGLDA